MYSNQKRFAVDVLDLLNELDESLMQLETNPQATAPLEQLFRTIHTIKGAASMFGFESIGKLSHHFETLFDLVRQGQLVVNDTLISITLQAFDKVRDLLKEDDIKNINSSDGLNYHIQVAIDFFNNIKSDKDFNFQDNYLLNKNDLATFFIRVIPNFTITSSGNNPLIFIVQDLEALGTNKTILIENEKKEVISWNIFLSTTSTQIELESNFLFVEQECKTEIVKLNSGNLFENSDFTVALENIDIKSFNPDQFKKFSIDISEEEEVFISEKKPTNDTIIKVSKRKIDDLLNWISELIILQTQIENISSSSTLPGLQHASEQLELITNHLRDTSLEIGLVPIETLVTKFKRLVRDLSKSLGKKINFVSEGNDTEMDKDLIELIAEPVMHILRNSIDHGIEKPDQRKINNKSEHGTIKLKAFNTSAYANIIISDDGRGIDLKSVLNKAIQKGLVTEGENLSDDEILNLIFHSGLSTASQLSDVSGRGVGMDIVQQRINELRGNVSIKSQVGKGTSIHIKLPLSRSIIEGLLLRVSNSRYVIPLNFVDRIDRISSDLIDQRDKLNKLVLVNNELLSVFSLRNIFNDFSNPPKTLDVISVLIDGVKKGIAVDKIEGKIQAVLKPLGELYQQQDYLAGSTILGDGTLALVLDPQRLFKYQT